MNEDKLKALLQQDQSLRDAIRQDEAGIAAACVAGILVVLLMPPRETMGEKEIVAKVEKKVEKKKETKPETPTKAKPNVKPVTPAKRQKLKMRKLVAPSTAPQQLIAQETTPAEPITVEQVAQVKTIAQAKTEILTERDIPITRPENYQYTPEEIALLKKQANEAYLKWVELELEIAKHNQEQTAQY